MITRELEFFSPNTLSETKELLAKFKGNGKILAGGQSLVPLMNLGIASPSRILDISRVRGLDFIKELTSYIMVGALATHRMIESSPIVTRNSEFLAVAAGQIGDPQVRNRGTMGGAICHADAAQDYPPVLIAAKAEINVESKKGKRIVNALDFFLDMFTVDLRPTELVTSVRIPKPKQRTGTSWQKLEFVSGGFAVTSAAALVEIDEAGNCDEIRVAIGGVEAKPILVSKLESELQGRRIGTTEIEEAGEAAFESVRNPLSDLHAAGDYRRDMARVLTRRSLKAAVSRAQSRGVK